MTLDKLFSPIRIGHMDLKNRLVMAPMSLGLADNGFVSQRFRDFYLERARGGAGLILIPFSVSYYRRLAAEKVDRMLPLLRSDAYLPAIKGVIDDMHAAGAKVGAQLAAFPPFQREENSAQELIAPSAVNIPGKPEMAMREMTIEEIQHLVHLYSQAARRAREAGFDCVEFHAVAGESIFSQFMSKLTNRRTDKYGGSVESRLRIITESLEAARREAGTDYTYMIRFSGDDFVKGGQTLDDNKIAAPLFEKAGFHALDVATGRFDAPVPFVQASVPRGAFVYLAEEIKKVVKVPVIGGARVNDPVLADDILVKGKTDLVWMGRPLIADPELPNKAKSGRLEDIRPCIACNVCLEKLLVEGAMPVCSVNSRAFKETELVMKPATRQKNVLVIGSGPAGMEAARVACSRGHKVTVWEKTGQPGGQLAFACCPPHKQELRNYLGYLSRQLEKCGTKVVFNKTATPESVLAEQPDAVVIASGAVPIVPPFPGVSGANVALATDVLTNNRRVEGKVVIVGGGMVGCETAEFLADQGIKEITLLEMAPRIGSDIGPTSRWVVMGRLKQYGVKMETKAKVTEITTAGVMAERDGQPLSFEAGTVVIAVGMKPNDALAMALEGKISELHSIGDSVKTQKIVGAIASAGVAASRI